MLRIGKNIFDILTYRHYNTKPRAKTRGGKIGMIFVIICIWLVKSGVSG